jgi:CheY-like chemotaxis protein/two-component sensor histidine kinase
LLLKESPSNEQNEYLQLIKQSADHLLVIINDILDLSKIRSGKIIFENIELNLREMMRSVFMATNTKALEKNLNYNFTVDSNVPDLIKGDKVRLNQILLNLITNAIKFTGNGRVHFSARVVNIESKKVFIQFKVEDSGIGILEKDQAKIFEPYRQASSDTTRKYGGTGLGLPIVKQLVEQQGGEIKVTSHPGEGSTFYFTIPFKTSEKIKSDKHVSTFPSPLSKPESAIEKNGINILLVDDNFINRLLVIHLLENKGYSVIEAENGYQAIDKLKDEDIDLILMDISMPDLDGMEATRIIRKMDEAYLRNIPIIAMTAHAFQEQIQKALDSGMNDYLSKPFKPEELYQKILNLINPKVVSEELREENISDTEKYYDLSFLTQYYDNEKEFIQSILALYVKETPSSILQIENALVKKDWSLFKSLTHKIKTNIMMMGIKNAEAFVHDAASIDLKNVDEKKIFSSFPAFKKFALKAIEQIAAECL